jgi:energy-coupling factor transporter ATP-binding protein EcfA2
MRLTRLYVRFYKSFNYDYERKAARGADRDPWDVLDDGAFYPYVRVDIEPSITTIVGANESGKSHLLDAIEKLITGEGIDRRDFCRYSHYFSVEQGQRRSPDFGGEFIATSDRDVELANAQLGLELRKGDSFRLFRPNGGQPVLYVGKSAEVAPLDKTQAASLRDLLPHVFRVDARVPLPDSMALHRLTPKARRAWGSRRRRGAVIESFAQDWTNPNEIVQQAQSIFDRLAAAGSEADVDAAQDDLARALLFKVAKIDEETFKDLDDAINDEEEGYVQGIIAKINEALAKHLNFPRWWAQDREFRLTVAPREHELVFTIHDRTGTDYSFKERSFGLRYFLSYWVQLAAHEPPAGGQAEMLLMDEPDAYLSSQGQQDLLRILEEFAQPEDRSRDDQVIYVTHSPFLINRNTAERIRVLDKGIGDEGTRVVRDAARNHYEPLRSSLGAFVAETAFIGGVNLFVEGLADQVLIAGLSAHLRNQGTAGIDILDLNEVTIVPAGSAASIPYLVYLARGRDVVRPPAVALVDSDEAGKEAVRAFARGGARAKQVLAPQYIVQIGDWAAGDGGKLNASGGVVVRELEDLIPLPIAVAAARNYARAVLELSEEDLAQLRPGDIAAQLALHDGSLWEAVAAAFAARLGDGAHIEKVGFAKEVVAVVAASRGRSPRPDGINAIEHNFGRLLAELARRLRQAAQEEESRRLSNRLRRTIDGFLDDHLTGTTREFGRLLLENVDGALDDTEGSDRTRLEVQRLRREFKLDEDLTEPIERFDEFRERVAALRYQERLAHQEAASATPPIERPGAETSAAGKPAKRRATRSRTKTSGST